MSIGRIIVDLLARTGSFETDLDRAGKHAQKRAKEINDAFTKAGQAVGVALGVAAVGVAAWVKSTVDQSEELVKLAQISGTTTTEFQKLAAGADLVGMKQDKLADIFKDTQDKLGDFLQNGAGPLKDFFENIGPLVGVTADQFRGLSGPQALGKYVSALQKAGVSQSEMVFYMEAIASDATALYPLLVDNARGFKEAGDQAERLGAVLDEKTVAQSIQLRNQMVELQQQVDGLKNRVMQDLIPALVNLSTKFNAAAKSGKGFWASLVDFSLVDGSEARDPIAAIAEVEKTIDGLNKLRDELDPEKSLANRINEWVSGDIGDIDRQIAYNKRRLQVLRTLAQDIGAFDDMDPWSRGGTSAPTLPSGLGTAGGGGGSKDKKKRTVSQAELTDEQRALIAAVSLYQDVEKRAREYGESIAWLDKLFFDGAITVEQYDVAIAQLARSTTTAGEAIDKELQAQADAWLDLADPMREFIRNIEEIDRLTNAGFLSPEEAEKVKDYIGELNKSLTDSEQFMKQFYENAQANLGDGLYDMMQGNFDSIGKSFANMIQRMVADAMAADIMNSLFGSVGKDGGRSGGAFGAIFSGIAGFFGGGKADGGRVSAGMAYEVGERGRELFIPSTDGVILPNHALGGKSGDNITISVRVDSRTDAAEVQRSVQRGVSQALGVALDSRQRYGAFARG